MEIKMETKEMEMKEIKTIEFIKTFKFDYLVEVNKVTELALKETMKKSIEYEITESEFISFLSFSINRKNIVTKHFLNEKIETFDEVEIQCVAQIKKEI